MVQFSAHHVAISVEDMQESISFYEKLGFTVVADGESTDGGLHVKNLKLGDFFLEIFHYSQHVAAPIPSRPLVGMKHFSLRVPSLTAAKEFFEDAFHTSDITISRGRTGIEYFFVNDPSGIAIEIVEDNIVFVGRSGTSGS